MNRISLALALTLACGQAFGQQKSATSITIYSSAEPGAIGPELYRPTPQQQRWGYQPQGQVPGYAIVREDRPIMLAGKVDEVKFTDVASLIDPTTVSFTCPGDKATSVLEQNYQFDLVSSDKLLERYIDKPITAIVQRGDQSQTVSGTLISASGGQLVLNTGKGLELVNGYTGLSFPELPEGLITRPTLIWKVAADAPGAKTARVSYETQGVTWWADYNLTFAEGSNANSGTLDVGAWVSIINQSGAGYTDATLKLVAGDVNRAPRPQNMPYSVRGGVSELAAADGNLGFQQKAFFEYHLYTLGRPATLPDNSTKQLELFPKATGVPCEKVLVYDGLGADWWWGSDPMLDENYGAQSKKDVDVYLRFTNDAKSGMGMPLPAGRIRVSKVDPDDGAVEFIGEDIIRHTPQGEQVLVKLGKAFDVVGERRQTNFTVDHARRTMEETYEIKVRNRKKEAAMVVVQERMFRWATWEISRKNTDFTKKDSRRVHFTLNLKPDEEGVVTYTVRYTW